jgi:hypothetical protein
MREMPVCIGNLNKLQNLEITSCPNLSKRCRRGTGEDWPKIKHIPKIKNDGDDDDDNDEETSHAGSSSKPYLNLSYLVLHFYPFFNFFFRLNYFP